MTTLEVIGLNNSPSDYQMVLYVGGISSSVKDVIPLAWQVIPFAARTTSGPTRIVATWTVKFGFTLMMKGSGNVVYTSSQIWDDFPLGSTLTINYNKTTGTYSGTPGEGGEPGSLTFLLGPTIPALPSTTTIGITMNGKAIGAVDPLRFLPNTKIVFYITPRYTVNAAYSLVEGQDVNAVQMVTTPLSVPFPDGITTQTAQLSFDNRWSLKSPSLQPQSLDPSSFSFCPSSIQISTYGDTVINIQNYPFPGLEHGASPKTLPSPSPKPLPPAATPQAWIFSDDLKEAHPVSLEAGALLAASSPNVLVLTPDGDPIPLKSGEDEVMNIPDTTGDNREKSWIKFWSNETGYPTTYTCAINKTDCSEDKVGAHVYVNGKGEQWYITDLCKRHNHYTRKDWMEVGIDTKAVPIATRDAAVLREFYARKAQTGRASIAEVLRDLQKSNGKQKQGFLLQQIN